MIFQFHIHTHIQQLSLKKIILKLLKWGILKDEFSQTGSSNFSKIVEKYNGEIVATNDWNENVSLVEQGRVADENITMIIVTHEMSFAHQISDKVIFMDQGQIVESSTAKQIFDHPQMPRTQQFLARYRGDTDYII